MGQPTVVSIDRWSLQRDISVSLRWPMGQPTVVSMDMQVVLIKRYITITEVATGQVVLVLVSLLAYSDLNIAQKQVLLNR